MTRHHHRASAAAPAPIDLNPRREPALDFADKSFADMSADDYAAIGFMCGLEVHQQLATASKLFCRCPSGRRVTSVDAEVLRHMRPTLSEMGEYDGCALMEFKTKKEIVYLLERGTVCTYEMDDTPPFEVDEEAVRFALEISRRFDLDLVSELHVMRKQYLDGSIPTGFQRTAMVGLTGVIPFRESELGSQRELRIRQLSLEEDSCREVSDVGHRITFRTDRLGTPLIETVTEPELLTPRDAQAGGRLLARVARQSGMVRRGPGAARQDVNVSVAGSRRVELKGVDNLRVLPRLVHTEAFRQLNLLRIRAALEERGIVGDDLPGFDQNPALESAFVADVTGLVKAAGVEPARTVLARGGRAWALRLPGFGDLVGHATQPGLTFANELLDRVRVIACLTGRPFALVSGIHEEALSGAAWREIRSAVSAEQGDALVVAWGPEDDVETAIREAAARAREALDGVPSETRQAHANATSGFERILPGPERMYPDTDTPPLPIPDAWVESIDGRIGERPWERVDRYRELGLTLAQAVRLVDAPWVDLFDALGPRRESTARRLAAAFEKRLVHFWREVGSRSLPQAERLAPLVGALDREELRPEAFEAAFDRLLREQEVSADAILAPFKPGEGDGLRLDELVAAASDERGAYGRLADDALLRWAMGQVMPTMLGKLSPGDIRTRLASDLELVEVAS